MKKKKITIEDIGPVSHIELTDEDLRNQSQDVLKRYEEGLRDANYQIKIIQTKTKKEVFIKDFAKEVIGMRDSQVMTLGAAMHEMLIYK